MERDFFFTADGRYYSKLFIERISEFRFYPFAPMLKIK